MKELLNCIKINFNNLLALCILCVCFSYFFWISGSKVPETNHNIGEIKTAMISIVMLIVGFYFGSSKSSSKKDDTIQQMQNNLDGK